VRRGRLKLEEEKGEEGLGERKEGEKLGLAEPKGSGFPGSLFVGLPTISPPIVYLRSLPVGNVVYSF